MFSRLKILDLCLFMLQVLSVITFKFVPEPVLIKIANHTECRCMEPAIIRRNAQLHRSNGSAKLYSLFFPSWELCYVLSFLISIVLQLLSNATAVKRLQTTLCQWFDLGLFHRQMRAFSLKYIRCVYDKSVCKPR